MYTILVTDGHELRATQRERIMQRSSLVDKFHFLVPPNYDSLDMSATTVCMEYLTPASREYRSEILVASEELYKDHLEFIVPMDTKLTREPGDLEIQLTFTMVSMNADGTVNQYVRKTSPTTITIVPIAAWADVIPDDALTALDQRLIALNAMANQLADINNALADSIPNTLVEKDGKLHIGIDGEPLVDSVGVDVVFPGIKDINDSADDGLIELFEDSEDDEDDQEDDNWFIELG